MLLLPPAPLLLLLLLHSLLTASYGCQELDLLGFPLSFNRGSPACGGKRSIQDGASLGKRRVQGGLGWGERSVQGSVGWGKSSEKGEGDSQDAGAGDGQDAGAGDGQDAGAGASDKRAYWGRWGKMASLERRWPFLKQRGLKRAEESGHWALPQWAGGAMVFGKVGAGVVEVGGTRALREVGVVKGAGEGVKGAGKAEQLILYQMNPFMGRGAEKRTSFRERLINRLLRGQHWLPG